MCGHGERKSEKEKKLFLSFSHLKTRCDFFFSLSPSHTHTHSLSLSLIPTEGPSAALSMNLDRAKTRLAMPEKFHPLIYQEQKNSQSGFFLA